MCDQTRDTIIVLYSGEDSGLMWQDLLVIGLIKLTWQCDYNMVIMVTILLCMTLLYYVIKMTSLASELFVANNYMKVSIRKQWQDRKGF